MEQEQTWEGGVHGAKRHKNIVLVFPPHRTEIRTEPYSSWHERSSCDEHIECYKASTPETPHEQTSDGEKSLIVKQRSRTNSCQCAVAIETVTAAVYLNDSVLIGN